MCERKYKRPRLEGRENEHRLFHLDYSRRRFYKRDLFPGEMLADWMNPRMNQERWVRGVERDSLVGGD